MRRISLGLCTRGWSTNTNRGNIFFGDEATVITDLKCEDLECYGEGLVAAPVGGEGGAEDGGAPRLDEVTLLPHQLLHHLVRHQHLAVTHLPHIETDA